ncbi:MAG: Stp1/IreP family PP2C-type Ser/Thr phosphatase [Syntrophobacteraceae bacterium]
MDHIISFGKSDPGLRRPNNEDAFLIEPKLGLNILADGMGGAAAGELASQIFTETARELFTWPHPPTEDERMRLLQQTYEQANARILDHVTQHQEHRGMGCTAELLLLWDSKFVLGHIGDSRTYLYRKGRLKQLTRDHSLVQDQVDQGLITTEEARTHRMRHVILRAVGTGESLAVDFLRGNTFPGDLFLLCSDGLTDMVDDRAIEDVLALPIDLSQRVEKLIDSAKAAGGHDNVTVILSEVITK